MSKSTKIRQLRILPRTSGSDNKHGKREKEKVEKDSLYINDNSGDDHDDDDGNQQSRDVMYIRNLPPYKKAIVNIFLINLYITFVDEFRRLLTFDTDDSVIVDYCIYFAVIVLFVLVRPVLLL
jgi:hypothetical protein